MRKSIEPSQKMHTCHFCGRKSFEFAFAGGCPYCGGRPWDGKKQTVKLCGIDVEIRPEEKERNNDMVTNAGVGLTNTNDHWETDIETIHECSKAPKSMVVKVDLIAKMKIDSLMEKYPNIEWLAYLIGKGEEVLPPDEDGKGEVIPADPLHIVDILIPEQEITAVRVDNIECEDFNKHNVVGVIHSHHGMGTGFSGTDHEFINGNHNLSLVIAKNGVAGQYRWQTPCGSLKIIDDIKVKVVYPEIGFNKEEWLTEETKKLKKPQPVVNTYGYGWNGYRGGHLNTTQRQYTTGVSSVPKAQADMHNVSNKDEAWETNIEEADQFQSLSDALNEAFN